MVRLRGPGRRILIPVTVLVRTLEAAKQLPVYLVGSIPLAALITYLALLVLAFWVELGLWRTVRRFGRYPDIMVLFGIHLALLLGLAVGVQMQGAGFLPTAAPNPEKQLDRRTRLRCAVQRDLHGLCDPGADTRALQR